MTIKSKAELPLEQDNPFFLSAVITIVSLLSEIYAKQTGHKILGQIFIYHLAFLNILLLERKSVLAIPGSRKFH